MPKGRGVYGPGSVRNVRRYYLPRYPTVVGIRHGSDPNKEGRYDPAGSALESLEKLCAVRPCQAALEALRAGPSNSYWRSKSPTGSPAAIFPRRLKLANGCGRFAGRRPAISPSYDAFCQPQNGEMTQIRAPARARDARQQQALEKALDFRADLSVALNGTALANYSTSIGGLHDPVGAVKRRRRSTHLKARECENVLFAAKHAIEIGAPLNRFLTIHFDAAGVIYPVQAVGRLLKLIGDWLRCYNSELTAIWVRETDHRKGEHVHILLSIPPQ